MILIYNPTTPPVYLDLGGALAAFGLIFAVYQLRKPKWEVILRVRPYWQRNLFWFLGIIGLVLVLIRVLPSEALIDYFSYPFNQTLFYEITAYLFFISSPLCLIYLSTNGVGLFNDKNARKFYEIMVQEISKSDIEEVNAALMVLLNNFVTICKTAHDNKKPKEVRESAQNILDVILSDEAIVKILTTKRLDALQFIFATVEKNSISRRESGIGIPKIVHNLLYDEESFFYKHLGREGLALSSNIYETIFSSPVLLTNFDLFGWPTIGYSTSEYNSIQGTSVLIEALSRAIATYLKTGNVPPRNINNGLSRLASIFGELCSKISTEEARGVDTKYGLPDEWRQIGLITNFLGHGYPFLVYDKPLNQVVVEREKTVPMADFYSNTTINAGIAGLLYKVFEQLSYIKNTSDVYFYVVQALGGIMSYYEYKTGYREAFEKRMWEQIAGNVIGKHYPATLRPYLEFIGFCLVADSGQRQGWIGEQAERMRRLLYVDMKPLLDTDTLMVNKWKMKDALLPTSMDYKGGKFTYRAEYGRGEEQEITPPEAGAQSALIGVDLQTRSLL